MEAAVPVLVATTGPIAGTRVPITPKGILLGREEGGDVVIPGDGVSRRHARVLLHLGAVWVQDQGSRNGVFVNGKRVVRHKQLAPGDELAVGQQTFTVEVATPSGDVRSETPRAARARAVTQPPTPPPAGTGSLGSIAIVALLLTVAVLLLLYAVR